MVFLAKLLTLPDDSMEILALPILGGRKQTNAEPMLITLASAINGWIKWSIVNLQCVRVLQKIADAVMGFVELHSVLLNSH